MADYCRCEWAGLPAGQHSSGQRCLIAAGADGQGQPDRHATALPGLVPRKPSPREARTLCLCQALLDAPVSPFLDICTVFLLRPVKRGFSATVTSTQTCSQVLTET